MAYHHYPPRCVLNKALLAPIRDKNDAQEPHPNRGVEGELGARRKSSRGNRFAPRQEYSYMTFLNVMESILYKNYPKIKFE